MTAPLRAKRKKGNMIIWALMGLLVVSLTGFGVTSVGSGGAQAIGSVGDRKVTVNEYVRALQAQMREFSQQIGQNLTMEQVQAFGIDRMVLQQVLATAALDGESDLIGLSVGDTTLGTLIANLAYDKLEMPKPVFIGDTLRCETEVIALRPSKSRPGSGVVTFAHRMHNQRNELVCTCLRMTLIKGSDT